MHILYVLSHYYALKHKKRACQEVNIKHVNAKNANVLTLLAFDTSFDVLSKDIFQTYICSVCTVPLSLTDKAMRGMF